MKINRSNYEIYFIDYLDGNLSIEDIDYLLDFFNENPDLKEELAGLEKIKIEDSNDKSIQFDQLLKTDFDHRDIFEETCIRAIENELGKEDQERFYSHIAHNSEHKKIFELFQATISEPDSLLVYENKQQLKKKPKIYINPLLYAVAAIFIIGLFFFIPDKTQKIDTKDGLVAEVVQQAVQQDIPQRDEIEKVIKVEEPVKMVTSEKKIQNQTKVNETILEERITTRIEPLTTLAMTVSATEPYRSEIALVPIDQQLNVRPKSYSKYLTLGEYFAELKQENKGFLGSFALNTLKKISGDKFDYSTSGGKVEKLEFNSKMLAFTIPIDN